MSLLNCPALLVGRRNKLHRIFSNHLTASHKTRSCMRASLSRPMPNAEFTSWMDIEVFERSCRDLLFDLRPGCGGSSESDD